MLRFIFGLFLLVASLSAGTITRAVTINPDELNTRSHLGYDVIELADGFLLFDPGEPALPGKTFTFVVPAGARISGITVTPLATETIAGRFNIIPVQEPLPISAGQTLHFVPPDPSIYQSDQPFPARPLIHHFAGNAGGFRLAGIAVCPFTYHPYSGRLLFHHRLQITIECTEKSAPLTTLTPTQKTALARSLRPLVVNPEELERFAPPVSETDGNEINYLIITTAELAPLFNSYCEYKTSHGLLTAIRTVDWIERNYPGRDLPEKIRNLIIDYYLHRGLVNVLLAGDNPLVPSRRIEVTVGNEAGSIPTDLYFGDLDYSWDSNHNNRFGEMEDSVDLYADVIVGRAPVDNPAQVINFINKVQTFENNPDPGYIKRSLLPSGWLWRSLNYHGKFVNDSIAGITPPDWTDRKMENPTRAGVVADSFNHGFLVFDPAGHGNESGVYDEDGTPIYTTSFAGRQTNNRRLTIITSLACNPGNFEAEDCLAEIALNCPDGGAIAVMMNSRYGWGTPPSMGPSEKVCVRFYDFLFNRNESLLGSAHNRSREEYAPAALYSSLWRWCLTEFNLLGDPTIAIWTETPAALNITAPDTILTGARTVTITVQEGSTPAPGALVTAYKNGEVFSRAITSNSGQATLNIHPRTTGTLTVTATRQNKLPATKHLTVLTGAPEPFIVYQRYEIDDQEQGNGNGVLEPGEFARLKLVLRNDGQAPATSTSLTLRTTNPALILNDTSAHLGTIAPGESTTTAGLSLLVLPSAPPGASVEMLGIINSDQDQFEITFSIELGYPGRLWADIDTGACALTITVRGTIGYDTETGRQGRGFRYPKTDTSALRTASFCLGNSSAYLVDRFYNQTTAGIDRDWELQDSIRVFRPIWNTAEMLKSSFNDRAHPGSRGIVVDQRALGLSQPGPDNAVVLVYDIYNTSTETIPGFYAGIVADFDVRASDRFHDIARTIPQLNSAYMRHINSPTPCVGVKLLYPQTTAHLTCIDHGRYVYPDSGLTDDMKLRTLQGVLGVPASDRPYNWSIAVATGPFSLPANLGRQRLAFAFIAARDSVEFITSATAIQEWFDANVAISENVPLTGQNLLPALTILPAPFTTRGATIRYYLPSSAPVRITALDITGRTIATIVDQYQPNGLHEIKWQPQPLNPGIYFIKLQTDNSIITNRIIFIK